MKSMWTLETVQEWNANPANSACPAGKAFVERLKSLRSFYDNNTNPDMFIFRICVTAPKQTLELLSKCLERIPTTNIPDELLKARSLLLDPASVTEEMTRQLDILDRSRYGNYHEYSRSIYYLLRWRLGLQPPTIGRAIVKKLIIFMKQIHIEPADKLLLGYMKELMTYEAWINTDIYTTTPPQLSGIPGIMQRIRMQQQQHQDT